MQNQNEFVLKVNNEEYVVSNESLMLFENTTNNTKIILNIHDYIKLTDEIKNKFILEDIGN